MSISDRADSINEAPRTADNAVATMVAEAAQLLESNTGNSRAQRQQEPLELVFSDLHRNVATDQQSRSAGSRTDSRSATQTDKPPEKKKPDSASDKDKDKESDKKPGSKPQGDRTPEGDRTTPAPDRVQPRQITDLEVAKGTNDISEQLGKGARLVRGDNSDVLTLPSGHRIEVRRDNVNRDGVAMIVVRDASGRQTADLRIGRNDTPIANINDGAARTMIRVTPNGQIETIRTNGKTYRLVPPKLD